MELESLQVYNKAMSLGEEVWNIVDKWDFYQKDTIGKQLVRSADSVAANISEGYGRFHYKESKNFGYYSRGALYETKTWLQKAHSRKMISDQQFKDLQESINTIGKMLNGYIRSIGRVDEPEENYGPRSDEPND